MEKKYMYIIGIVVVIIAVAGAVAFLTLNKSSTELTPFDTKFMSGSFVGDDIKDVSNDTNGTSEWSYSFRDENNKIDYSVSSCKNFTYEVGIYRIQGAQGPEIRDFGDVSWTIYYSKGTLNNTNDSNSTSTPVNIYICEATQDNQSYLVTVVAENSSNYKCDGTPSCELFTTYISPLLESIKLKQNDDVIEPYTKLNISQSDYDSVIEQVNNLTKQL